MLGLCVDPGRSDAWLAGSNRKVLVRPLVRIGALVFALTMLLVLLSCRSVDVVGTAQDMRRLATLRTFSIDTQPDASLYIWNMRSIPFEGLIPVVSERLEQMGYQPASPQTAEFRIVLSTFTEEGTPRTRITIMEVYERASSRKLWSGRAELPYFVEGRQGLAGDRTLSELLSLVPRPAVAEI